MPARDAKTHRRAKDAVSDYVAHHRADAAGELDFYRAIPTLRRAISKAARAHTTDDGKHPHQQLIPCEVLRSFGARLVRRERTLREAQSFDDLHRVVQSVGDLVPGIGPLAVYDTALWIGARLDLSPTRVYLHRGTRDGAEALGVDRRLSTVSVSELPRAFARLAPHEIEDCLCIFKGLLSGTRTLRATGCRCAGQGCARRPDGTARARC